MFGVPSAIAVAAGLKPERPVDPTPMPSDQLRVKVDGVWHDVLTVPSASQEPPVHPVVSGSRATLGEMKGWIHNAAPPKVVVQGRMEIGGGV